jgi:hypothetical protein|nr:MAG TPA: hypothetical protein [Caudoviricetes sp.]
MTSEEAMEMLNGSIYHIDHVYPMMSRAREMYNWYDDDYKARKCKSSAEFYQKYGNHDAIIWFEFVEGSNSLVCIFVTSPEDLLDN